jgi:hypothetical protein
MTMSATGFSDATARNQQAAADLAERDAEKRRASVKDPFAVDADYAAKSAGRRWVGENAFDQQSGGRTT